MYIKNLDLKDFRNYGELHINFESGSNLLYGDNAQGKTNILEAVYMCSSGKSHRANKDREIIKFSSNESHIKASIEKRSISYVIDLHLKKNSPKGIAINGVPIRKTSELFGLLNIVFFSPEDLNIIKEGPSGRRKFIDMELCQLSPLYVSELIHYNKLIIQKNCLLKDINSVKEWKDLLDIYDEQLRESGGRIQKERKEFIGELNRIIKNIHRDLTDEKEDLKLEYEPNEFRSLRQEELKQKVCLSGPQRDDMAFYISGMDLRKYGSQGQQRTAALSLKLAELELVKNKTGESPVLLLDDVLSELDTKRQNNLLKEIKNIQTIITCTGIEDYMGSNLNITKTMYVKDGHVSDVEE